MIGEVFSKLTVIKEVDKFIQPSGQSQRGFLCICECGNEKIVRKSHLKHGKTKSCGCLHGESHGASGTKLHNTWRGMRQRCNKPIGNYINKNLSYYILWDSFKEFKSWAIINGWKDGLTIDRIDNSKGYYPNNCRFVTNQENCNNRDVTLMIEYNGCKVSLSMLLKEIGRHGEYGSIYLRIKRGWNHQEAIDIPIRKGNYKNN